jgi:hypothetical protein
VRLWRKVGASGLLQDPHTLALFIYILINAAHEPMKINVKRKVIQLEKGQTFLKGRAWLASHLKQSERSIRTGLDTLQASGTLTSKSTSVGTIVTLTNFGTYQRDHSKSGQQVARKATSKRPASDQRGAVSDEMARELQSLKNYKNYKK